MGPVRGVLLDESLLFSESHSNGGNPRLLPSAEILLLRLQYSKLHVGITYKACPLSQKETFLQNVAVLYSMRLVKLDASCSAHALEEASSAWGVPADMCIFVTSELDEILCHNISSHGWAVVFQGSEHTVSGLAGVTTIHKLQELLCTLCLLNKLALGDAIVTVGYVMKWTREKDFIKRGAFPIIPTSNGLMFVPIDLDLPLMPQLQAVDLVLHKATDEISSVEHGLSSSITKGIRFSEGIQQLERYLKRHLHYCLIDPFENVTPLLDRVATQHILQGLVEINNPSHCRIRAPHFLKVSNLNEPNLMDQLGQAQLVLPTIVKPQIACGVPNAHTMAVVFKAEEFVHLPVPLPAVIQEYIDHGSILYKFYVLGEKVFYAIRRSMPDASSLSLSSESQVSSTIVFDSLKSLPIEHSYPDSVEDLNSEVVKMKLDHDTITAAAMWLREKLQLTIFGFDVVIQTGTGDHVIVDVNYLPSFKEIPDDCAIPAFWDAIKSSYLSFQLNQQQVKSLGVAITTWKVPASEG